MPVDALTFGVSKGNENVSGKLLEQYVEVTLSSGYPNTGTAATTGYTFPQALATQYGQLGIRRLSGVIQTGVLTAGIGYTAQWDKTAGKLHIFTAGAEIANNVSLATVVLILKLFGTR